MQACWSVKMCSNPDCGRLYLNREKKAARNIAQVAAKSLIGRSTLPLFRDLHSLRPFGATAKWSCDTASEWYPPRLVPDCKESPQKS